MEVVLKPEHLYEVQKYLLFFKQKREESLREADAALQQFASQSVTDIMMSKDEVVQLLKDMTRELKSTLEAELANIVRMSAIYIRTLLYQGEQQGMSFQADTSYLENQRMIEEMAKLEKHQKTLAELSRAPTGGARLPTLQSGFSNDPTLVQELREKKEEVGLLKERINRLQTQLSTALSEKEELTERLGQLEALQSHQHVDDDAAASQAREISQELLQAKVTPYSACIGNEGKSPWAIKRGTRKALKRVQTVPQSQEVDSSEERANQGVEDSLREVRNTRLR